MGEMKSKKFTYRTYITALAVVSLVVTGLCLLPKGTTTQAASTPGTDLYTRAVPDIDMNFTSQVTRTPTGEQQAAAANFKAQYSKANVRWNNFAGSPDVMMGFH